jgi:ankyrin repeat protein/ketosteroid isomerase-like protein
VGENRIESPPEFIEAVKRGDVSKVRDLVRANPALLSSRTKRGLSPVLVALYSGQKVAAANLIALGADLDVHDAAAAGRLERVKELVEREPSLANAVSAEGFPPMGLAAYLGNEEVVEYLISKGADVNFTAPSTGFTALTGAVSQRHARIADILVRHGAEVNHVYEGTLTPLLVATSQGDLDLVRLLLDHGADPNLGGIEGKRALDIAKEKGSREVAEALRRHSATRWAPEGSKEGAAPVAADPKAVLEKVRRAMNAHDLEGLLALMDPEYESEQPAHPDRAFQGREQVRKNWSGIFSRVPDLRADVLRTVVDGDTVWTEWQWHGVRGDGTKFDYRGVTLFRIWNGKLMAGRLFMEPVQERKKEGPYGGSP